MDSDTSDKISKHIIHFLHNPTVHSFLVPIVGAFIAWLFISTFLLGNDDE